MGCDGGTIPRRDELVRLKKKPEQKDKESELAYRWRHCSITQQPLQEPIVMCGLGRLYSKQNVIEHLLEKDKMPGSASHIKSLKDVKNLQLTPNPVYTDCDKTEGSLDVRSAPYICKLIGLEMTGKFRFVALWTCGCVFSERALKEIKSKNCSLCHTPFAEEDVVILNGNEEDTDLMLSKMQARTARQKAAKKEKKAKNQTKEITQTVTSADQQSVAGSSEQAAVVLPTSSHSNTKPTHTVKPNLKREAKSDALIDPDIKKLKDGVFSVAEDKSKTEVYKSLFTSHKSEQNQSRAHWVTYNPFYN
ncbi:replication termination factor 2 [Bradysia coprophila]|uniref:replication termination factor 2 n=1 Tax=Bradysia coprophila TaxID=38358 RepID=UPI00187D70C6|nr:replication termination factor 2 [Bradysia coprophila]